MILVGGERAGCRFAFLWSVACVLSVIVCLLFLLVSLRLLSVIVSIHGHLYYY